MSPKQTGLKSFKFCLFVHPRTEVRGNWKPICTSAVSAIFAVKFSKAVLLVWSRWLTSSKLEEDSSLIPDISITSMSLSLVGGSVLHF